MSHPEGTRTLALEHTLLPLTNWHGFSTTPAHLEQIVECSALALLLAAVMMPVACWAKMQLKQKIIAPAQHPESQNLV